MLPQLLQRAAQVPFTTPMAAETLRAMALLPRADDQRVIQAFTAIARRDSAATSAAFQKIRIDATNAEHGRRVALLCRALSHAPRTDAVVWQGLEAQLINGLTAAAWRPIDVRDALRGAARWGTYARETLPVAADRYAATKAPFADPFQLADIALGLTSLAESRNASSLHAVAQRLIQLAANAPAATFGGVCRSMVRARFKSPDLLRAVTAELPRITPQLRGADATAVLAFWALHEYEGVVPLVPVPSDSTGAGRRAAAMAEEQNAEIGKTHALLTALMKQAVAEMPDDADGIVAMLRCVTAFSQDQWVALSAPIDEALEAAAVMSQELVAAGSDAIGVEALTALMPRFFRAVRDRPQRLMPMDALTATMNEFARVAEARAEELVAHESSPYFIVTCLLGAPGDPPPKACRDAATHVLLEAQAQEVQLPTLQTFRYLLSYGDHRDFDRRVLRYLRKCFAATLEGIPLVQLVTALRCFAVAELTGFEDEAPAEGGNAASAAPPIDEAEEARELEEFLSDVAAALRRRDFAYDLRLLLALVHAVSLLAPPGMPATDAFREHFLRVIVPLVTPQVAAENYNKHSAAASLGFLAPSEAQREEIPAHVLAFLEATVEGGASDDPLEVKPSKWMKDNDPSSAILPRTPAELKLDAVLRDVTRVKPDDEKALAKLGAQFVKLLPDVHADNVRLLFEVFAERVIKQDKLLRDALAHLVESGAVPQLSPFSVASMLHCAAAVRFSYYKQLKQLIERVTEEQWASFDPAELELAVAALARLSIRTPAVLLALSERAVALAPALTERHVCSIIAGFQSLGVHDEALFAALLSRAAQVADQLTPSAVALLLSGPQAHRLPVTEETAGPLVSRLCRVADDLAPHQKTRVGQTLRKMPLPPSLLAGATSQLMID